MSVLSQKHFHDEAAAYKFVEARVWPNGPVCPHCGGVERIGKMGGKSTRIGAYKCYQCRKPFTVKLGTIFESSHVKMNLWLQAIFLMASSKKGISANQLHRTLGVTLKTAWFMAHRIREAMREGAFGPLGGEGKTVEADETYFGKAADQSPRELPKTEVRSQKQRHKAGQRKMAVLSLVERDGAVRSFHVAQATKVNVAELVSRNIKAESELHTDQSNIYIQVGKTFAAHETTNHSKAEYVRYDGGKIIHSNTVENYFSVFKRGMRGTYQHCAEKHLHRYLAEFDFRHNRRIALGVSDEARANSILSGVIGKRLTYETAQAR